MESINLPAGKYDAGSWQYTTVLPADIERCELTLATFNIWFGDWFVQERYRAVLDLLEHYRPDVIALQEVTLSALPIFLEQPWIRGAYYASDINGSTLGDYGVLILSRLPPRTIKLVELPSFMGRHLLVWETRVNGAPLHIATVHLESQKSSVEIRGEQLGVIFDALHSVPNAVIMGDFNFCASWTEENDRLDPVYHDVWKVLRAGEPGYTEDAAINRMLYLSKGKHKQVRFDRVLLKSSLQDVPGSGWTEKSIDLLGTDPISVDMPEVFPSDHFGLLCRIAAKGSP